MKVTKTNPDTFLNSLPEDRVEDMKRLDALIVKAAPKGTNRVMWEGIFWGGSEQSIIGYGAMQFTNSKKETVDWFAVGLANQKGYITVYVNGYEDGMGLAKKYADKLGKVKTTTSAVNIKNLDDVNLEQLEKVIKKSFELAAKT